MHRSGVWWVAAGAALWGTDSVFRQPLTSTMSPVQIVFIEHLILVVLLTPYLMTRGPELLKIPLRGWAAIAAVGWIGSVAATVLFTAAVASGNPTAAVLLQKLQPVFAIVMARVVLGERLPSGFARLLACGVAGAVLISSSGWPSLGGAVPSAAVFAILAAVGWGSATVFGRFASQWASPHVMTALRIVLAFPLIGALALAEGVPSPTASQWPPLLMMALLPGLLALLFYYRGLGRTSASSASIAELAFPASAALLNWTVLGVYPTVWQIVGFLLIWSAIYVLSAKRQLSTTAE